jgi:serine/threonine-protein kinase HipA
MWGLLPDNELILQRWGIENKVSPKHPFGLLAAVGEDCPGAIQLLKPGIDPIGREGIKWLSDEDFIERIKKLKADPAAVRQPDDTGRISLPGAQIKTALYRDRSGKRWGVPQGRTPTTHILKPEPITGLATIEHFTLLLMRGVGMSAAESEVLLVDDIPVFVTTRYDRYSANRGPVRRIHQEDMCQALGLPPAKKYQNEGGPGIPEIMDVLRFSSSPQEDRSRFIRAQAFNMLVGNGDAHAKNYSLLYTAGGAFRLSPFYDFIFLNSKQLAMTIGGEREVDKILPRHWERMARLAGYDKDKAIAQVRDLIARLPGAALSVREACVGSDASMKTIDDTIAKLWDRVRTLSYTYGSELIENADLLS